MVSKCFRNATISIAFLMMITVTPVNDSNTILALENREVHHGLVCYGWDQILFRGDQQVSIRAERMNVLFLNVYHDL